MGAGRLRGHPCGVVSAGGAASRKPTAPLGDGGAAPCLVGWGLRQWVERATLEVPLYVAIGMSLAFHWLMTADELQEQRRAWHMETYLLAVSLVFGVTLVVTAACLPLVAPELSFVQMLGTGLTQAQAIYTTFIQRLFL